MEFDATLVAHETVSFEGATETHLDKKARSPRRQEEDVDGDGDTDRVFHLRLGDTTLTCPSVEVTLTGSLYDETPFTAASTVEMKVGTRIITVR